VIFGGCVWRVGDEWWEFVEGILQCCQRRPWSINRRPTMAFSFLCPILLCISFFHCSTPEGHCHSDGKRDPPMRKRRRFAVPPESVGPNGHAWKCNVMYRNEELTTTRGFCPMRYASLLSGLGKESRLSDHDLVDVQDSGDGRMSSMGVWNELGTSLAYYSPWSVSSFSSTPIPKLRAKLVPAHSSSLGSHHLRVLELCGNVLLDLFQ
jgi:hypothetical protein